MGARGTPSHQHYPNPNHLDLHPKYQSGQLKVQNLSNLGRCPAGKYNDLATAFLANPDDTIRHIFSLGSLSPKAQVCQGDNCYFTLRSLIILCPSYLIFMTLSAGIAIPGGLFMPSMLVQRPWPLCLLWKPILPGAFSMVLRGMKKRLPGEGCALHVHAYRRCFSTGRLFLHLRWPHSDSYDTSMQSIPESDTVHTIQPRELPHDYQWSVLLKCSHLISSSTFMRIGI